MFCYYLMDLYGRIPLVTDSHAKVSTISQSERSETFRWIVNQLMEVAPYLPDEHSNRQGNYYGRITRPVAHFLLAKLMINAEVYADDDWTDERVWKKANPNLGVSVKPDFLRSEYKRAQEVPAYENTFRRLYLNQWTRQETRWIPMEAWDQCPAFDPGDLDGEPCYIGLDLSSTTDLTSLTVWYPLQGVAVNHNWMPEELVEYKSRLDQIPYWDWIRQGIVEITPGNVVDYGFIRERILDIASRNSGLRAIGYDPWNATQLMIQIEQDDGLPVAPIRQGFRTLSPASKELERLVTARALNHLGNPALRRAAENVRVKADENGNLRPVKNSATGRIDPLMSLIIAIAAQQQTEGVQTGPSVYEERGLLSL